MSKETYTFQKRPTKNRKSNFPDSFLVTPGGLASSTGTGAGSSSVVGASSAGGAGAGMTHVSKETYIHPKRPTKREKAISRFFSCHTWRPCLLNRHWRRCNTHVKRDLHISKETHKKQKEQFSRFFSCHTWRRCLPDRHWRRLLFCGWGLINRGRWRRYDTDVKRDLHTSKQTDERDVKRDM